MKAILTLLQSLLSFFYPKTCVACGRPLLLKEQFFCLFCLHKFPETQFHTLKEHPYKLLFEGRVKIEKIFTLFYFIKGGSSQKILHQLKYHNNKELGDFLGFYYGNQIRDQTLDIDFLIPIPLHKKKKRKRGYNQSEWIAKGVSRATGVPVLTDLMIRKSFTDTQTKKGRYSRWENVKSAFEVVPEKITEGAHYLIIDDVLTTGATIEASASNLLCFKDVKVSVLTLAAVF